MNANAKDKTLLIVDDVEDNRAILSALFENEYTILEASDGLEAVSILQNEYKRISLVMLDINMPNMDGFEVLQLMKKKKDLFDIPVVIISGLSEIDAEIKALEMGADDFIVKPFDARVVIPRINNLVVRRAYESVKLENMQLHEEANIQKKMQVMLNTVPGGIGIFELDGEGLLKMILGNDGLFSMLGYANSKQPDSFYKNFTSIVYPIDVPQLARFTKASRDNMESFSMNIRLLRSNGSWLWTMLTARPVLSTQGTLQFYSVLVDVSVEQKIKDELLYQADYDKLTGIYNEDAFYRLTSKMLHENLDFSYVIICWNIERFKLINDIVGKDTADLILKIFADALRREAIKNMGTYGRLEADRFAACFQYALFDENTIQKELLESLARHDLRYPVSVISGVYIIDDTTLPIPLMCDRANLALQTIKGNYHKRCAYYDTELLDTILIEQEIRNEMKNALSNREFIIYLQPIYSIASESPVSAETLVRWNHPEKGIITPNEFIPVFERSGFIADLDYYIWEEVCRYINERQKRGLPDIPISLNVSRASLYSLEVFEVITSLINKYSVPPSLFRLEITETAYSDNPDQLLTTISELQKTGISILMDDFGSGYSSLNTLKDIPVDILKIDMKFIESLDVSLRAGNIITSIVRMAVRLDLPIIAEGVETKEQIDFLFSIGCDQIQGYYYARPMIIDDFEKHLADRKLDLPTASENNDLKSIELDMLLGGSVLIDRLLNSMDIGIALCEIVDNRMEMLRINQYYYRIFGHSPSEFIKKSMNFIENVSTDDRDTFIHFCKNSSNTREGSKKMPLKCYNYSGDLIDMDVAVRHLGRLTDHSIVSVLFYENGMLN